MSIISIIGIILMWVVAVLILGVLGFAGLSYRLLRKIYIKIFEPDKDKSK